LENHSIVVGTFHCFLDAPANCFHSVSETIQMLHFCSTKLGDKTLICALPFGGETFILASRCLGQLGAKTRRFRTPRDVIRLCLWKRHQ